MPEREFDLYLSLLSRFLKLNPSQRGEISDELRTHLEDRLEELAARGLSREQAIHTALEELGDAAELAQHFTRATHIRRRRFIMRCTYGTVAALVAALLIGTAFWPQGPNGSMPPQVVAEDAIASATADDLAHALPVNLADEDARNAELEAKLDSPIDVAFHDAPLEDALRFVRKEQKVPLYIDRPTLADEGIALDTPVSLELSGFNLRTVLDLLLEPLQLTCVPRKGLLFVTTISRADEFQEVRVHNVQDLVVAQKATGLIINVITNTTDPESWVATGGQGDIQAYNGMLVVRQTYHVHRDVQRLLEKMRRARQRSQEISRASQPLLQAVEASQKPE